MRSHRTTCRTHKKHNRKTAALLCVALFSSAIIITPVTSYADNHEDHIETSVSTTEVSTTDQTSDDQVGAAKGCATGAAIGTALAPGVGTLLGCVAMGIWGWFW